MMITLFIAARIALAKPTPPNFSVAVTIHRESEPPKGGRIEMKDGVCKTSNGPKSVVRKADICKTIYAEIEKDQESYTALPWATHEASFTVEYQSGKQQWTRETGLMPDAQSKPREALRKLAVKVLETAK